MLYKAAMVLTIGCGSVSRTEICIEVRARDILRLRRRAGALRSSYSRVEQAKVFRPAHINIQAIIILRYIYPITVTDYKEINYTARIGQV